jgi:hypothetical protein
MPASKNGKSFNDLILVPLELLCTINQRVRNVEYSLKTWMLFESGI